MGAWPKIEFEVDLSELGIGLSVVSPKNVIFDLIFLHLWQLSVNFFSLIILEKSFLACQMTHRSGQSTLTILHE